MGGVLIKSHEYLRLLILITKSTPFWGKDMIYTFIEDQIKRSAWCNLESVKWSMVWWLIKIIALIIYRI